MRVSQVFARWNVVTAIVLAVAMLAPGTGARGQGIDGPGGGYLDFDGLTRELRTLVGGSDLARIRSIATTHQGRDVWIVEIGAAGGAPLEERPGLLVVGNLEGDHLIGSALALETVRYLVSEAESEQLARVLANNVIYVVPRLNPDGAEAMFGPVVSARRGNARPYDDDNDGRVDEDPVEDLNGDGVITVMRVEDPYGEYRVDPEDSRLMKKAKPGDGEGGEYTLHWEGRDDDGDGFLNEDGPGGVDLNRNFQHAYPYWQADAGPHMISEPETRALMDFVIAHGNIGAILTFGLSDNLVSPADGQGSLADPKTLGLTAYADAANAGVYDVGVFTAARGRGFGFGFGFGGFFGRQQLPILRGAQPGRDNDPNSGRRPVTTFSAADREYLDAVSEAYREITGIERSGIGRKAEGAFFQYGYFQYGVPSFSTQGWGLSSEPEGEDEETGTSRRPEAPDGGSARRGASTGKGKSADAELLEGFDAAEIDAFIEWTPFTHPDLGEVEIGGFHPVAVANPDAGQVEHLGEKHGEFVVKLASMLPRVSIVDTSVTSHGGGVFTVTVEVENAGYFPTSLEHGVVSQAVSPTTVQIQVPPDDVLTGADKTSTIEVLNGSGAREKFTWLIRGREGGSVQIRVLAQKGGTDTATVTLR